jgi:hypothetical protein
MLVSLPKNPRDIRSCRPWNHVAASDQFSDFRDTHPGWAAPWVRSSIRQPGSHSCRTLTPLLPTIEFA